jgi:hypothetical protein
VVATDLALGGTRAGNTLASTVWPPRRTLSLAAPERPGDLPLDSPALRRGRSSGADFSASPPCSRPSCAHVLHRPRSPSGRAPCTWQTFSGKTASSLCLQFLMQFDPTQPPGIRTVELGSARPGKAPSPDIKASVVDRKRGLAYLHAGCSDSYVVTDLKHRTAPLSSRHPASHACRASSWMSRRTPLLRWRVRRCRATQRSMRWSSCPRRPTHGSRRPPQEG